jgi:hypothetical protein
MKRTFLAALLLATTLTGCRIVPMGDIVTRNYDFADFDKIDAGYNFDIQITRAEAYSIAITTRENVFDRLSVTVSDRTLKINLKNPLLNLGATPQAVITMPALRGLDLSGASKASATGFNSGDDFSAEISGSSSLDIDMQTGNFKASLSGASDLNGRLEASGTSFDLSGSSHVTLGGSGGNITIDASGASRVNMNDFTVRDASIELSGSSDADIVINGRLDVALSGASTLRYGGNPTLGNLDITGGSSLKRR